MAGAKARQVLSAKGAGCSDATSTRFGPSVWRPIQIVRILTTHALLSAANIRVYLYEPVDAWKVLKQIFTGPVFNLLTSFHQSNSK